MTVPSIAAAAYAGVSQLSGSSGVAQGVAQKPGAGVSFDALLKQAAGSIAEAGRNADSQAMALTQGKTNIMDVVTAVSETDVAISTLVSVRDRIIQSYEDIMRMPI